MGVQVPPFAPNSCSVTEDADRHRRPRRDADGLTAIARCSEIHPEVVLLDLGLPDMDGVEVARRIRPMLPPGALVVALTGYGQQDERIRTETSGFDRHVVKPVGFEEIRRLLSEIDRREPH